MDSTIGYSPPPLLLRLALQRYLTMPAPGHQSPTPPKCKYTLQLVPLDITKGIYFVEACLPKELKESGGLKHNPDCPADLQFNLTGMLGNDDGKFAWGRAAFEQTGRNFRIEKEADGYKFKGELLNLLGEYVAAEINLNDKLHVVDYVEQGTGELYGRLVERPKTSGRSLVLCFDGTSNHFSDMNTNVVKLVELLKKDDPSQQMVYYQTGVGTYSPPGVSSAIGLDNLSSKVDEGIAWYLYQHVIDGYKYLMQTYRAGDRIALFGFSRGAFTARALAGMIHCVGLLPRHNLEHVPFAYEVYKHAKDDRQEREDEDTEATMEALHPKDVDHRAFKRTFCVPITIDFVGVWDTVASVGAFLPKVLPHIEYNPSIITFRHALALDEHRGSFVPSIWDHSRTNPFIQDVREVWFRGEHSDIGGGSVGPKKVEKDGKKSISHSMLSNISLRWMVRQIIQSQNGIWLDHTAVARYRERGILETPPNRNWLMRVEESIKLDKIDVQNPLYDSIGNKPGWNVLEYAGFTSKRVNTSSYQPSWSRSPNWQAGRSIYCTDDKYPIFIHSSAVNFMARQLEKGDEDYRPRAKWYCPDEKWPRIEDISQEDVNKNAQQNTASKSNTPVQSNPVFPEGAKIRLDMDPPRGSPGKQQSSSSWRLWPF